MSRQLRDEAYRFDFFQAVRTLQRMARQTSTSDEKPQRFPVGEDHAPQREVVRFRVLPSHGFPAGPIAKVDAPEEDSLIAGAEAADAKMADAERADGGSSRPWQMTTTFMGLTGPNGVLPRHYTTLLIDRTRDKDFALRDFLDLFNHRVLSLFYRAWEKYRFAIAYERFTARGSGETDDLFTRCLYSLLGLGTSGLRGRMLFDDETFLYYAGHFAHHPRSAVSLELILADYFGMPVAVRQFQGQWLYLAEEDQSSLPSPRRPRGLNTQLGVSVVVGSRVWDVEGRFRIRLGPLDYRQFRRLTPEGDVLPPLCQLVRSYVGGQFDFDVQPLLLADEVPWCRLGGDGDDPARLGWNTWIRSARFDHDVSDAVFSLEGLPWTK